jgi:hypothetical protein
MKEFQANIQPQKDGRDVVQNLLFGSKGLIHLDCLTDVCLRLKDTKLIQYTSQLTWICDALRFVSFFPSIALGAVPLVFSLPCLIF